MASSKLCSTIFGFRGSREIRKCIVSSSRRRIQMAATVYSDRPKVIDSHLHVWASPQLAAEKYPYFPGQEPTLPGHVEFVLEDGFRAVRFNPYLWPSGQMMTNDVGRALFAKAGELGVPVGFMCMKGLNIHVSEIEELCTEFPSTVVLLDHLCFCKPPKNNEEEQVFANLLNLSRFPQVNVKMSALFRVSRCPYPYEDLCDVFSKVVSSYGANRIMWGSDFPYVVAECGYKEAKEAVCQLLHQLQLSPSQLKWIMG